MISEYVNCPCLLKLYRKIQEKYILITLFIRYLAKYTIIHLLYARVTLPICSKKAMSDSVAIGYTRPIPSSFYKNNRGGVPIDYAPGTHS